VGQVMMSGSFRATFLYRPAQNSIVPLGPQDLCLA